MKNLILTFVALSALFALAGCSEDSNPMSTSADKISTNDERTTLVDVAVAVNAETGEFSTLIAAVLATGLDGILTENSQKTVFAPTDAAFAALDLNAENIGELDTATLTEILSYHVAKGRQAAEDVVRSEQIRMLNLEFTSISLMGNDAYINNAMIQQTDVFADNGVIHVIDTVLMPGQNNGSDEMDGDWISFRDERISLVDMAVAVNAETGEFSTLIAAVLATGLDVILSGNGQKTVFAPTDAAFAALDLNADNIGEMDTAALTEILSYHVAKGRRAAEDVVRSEQIRMLNLDFTSISVTEDGAFIDGARIVQTDVFADNGVIHVINSVLLPGQEGSSSPSTRLVAATR
jgi:uncharacterized surface protein with fasciclin (FAS1) repeats|nr:fasciclin domain-containing protein [Candidatus Krumholzibacteria bacterium]